MRIQKIENSTLAILTPIFACLDTPVFFALDQSSAVSALPFHPLAYT
jgi:hypothetical protein